ncbi:signal peptidase I [Phenylobacterium sp.]|jgi:signal peptidase I|uniref:signal peptidase I n=1 Tax=Phenylobacterium sp. TaxID=1871053 RepID=UPI002F93A07B
MTSTAEAAPATQRSDGQGGWETVKTVIYALLIALVLRVLLFQPFTIPSASMEPKLFEGDYVVVTKFSYGWSHHSIPFSPQVFDGRLFAQAPQRGDIAVFKTPLDNRTDLIKRIVGLPGDRIQMKQGVLHINGRAAPQTFLGNATEHDSGRPVARFREALPGGRTIVINDFGRGGELDDTPVYVVPEGHYFMMGDNRDNSGDSRVPVEAGGVGYVPAENLVGKAQVVLLAWKPGASVFKPWTWLNLDTSRFLRPLN